MKDHKATATHIIAPNLPEKQKDIQRAYQYHLRGLTAKEIGKLLDTSPRTVQRWKLANEFEALAAVPTQTETVQQKAVQMSKAGLSYSEIAKKLKKCKATIYNYVKQAKATPPPEIVSHYQPLFNYLHELGVIATQNEMHEITLIVEAMHEKNN